MPPELPRNASSYPHHQTRIYHLMGSGPEAQARFRLGVTDVGGEWIQKFNVMAMVNMFEQEPIPIVSIDVTQDRDPSNRGILASYNMETTSDVASGSWAAIRKVLEAEGVHEAGPQLLGLSVVTIIRN